MWADLTRAFLEEATLDHACLKGSTLSYAILRGASLEDAEQAGREALPRELLVRAHHGDLDQIGGRAL